MLKRRQPNNLRCAHRLRSNSGFTFTELLVTMAILALVGSVAAMGIPLAQKLYQSAVDTSNSTIMTSTAVSELRSLLSSAIDPITVGSDDDDMLVSYEDSRTGFTVTLYNDSTDGLSIREEKRNEAGEMVGVRGQVSSKSLLAEKANVGFDDGLRVEAGKIDYDPSTGIFTVEGLVVKRKNGDVIQKASIDKVEIRSLAAHKDAEE